MTFKGGNRKLLSENEREHLRGKQKTFERKLRSKKRE